uniref:Alternative protein GEMIN5 n=1 Tax=Homo sapiens TaxID=9606 RepID=L8E9U3_HUMAN|nr:alternative protein GEMIN5 [Homo sapiens]
MMEGWYLLPMMVQPRCGMLSGKSPCAISEDIEVDCFVWHGLLWIQTASIQGQMTFVCTSGSLPCKIIPGLLKAKKVLNWRKNGSLNLRQSPKRRKSPP